MYSASQNFTNALHFCLSTNPEASARWELIRVNFDRIQEGDKAHSFLCCMCAATVGRVAPGNMHLPKVEGGRSFARLRYM